MQDLYPCNQSLYSAHVMSKIAGRGCWGASIHKQARLYLGSKQDGRVYWHTQVDQAIFDLANTECVPALATGAKPSHILIATGCDRQILQT